MVSPTSPGQGEAEGEIDLASQALDRRVGGRPIPQGVGARGAAIFALDAGRRLELPNFVAGKNPGRAGRRSGTRVQMIKARHHILLIAGVCINTSEAQREEERDEEYTSLVAGGGGARLGGPGQRRHAESGHACLWQLHRSDVRPRRCRQHVRRCLQRAVLLVRLEQRLFADLTRRPLDDACPGMADARARLCRVLRP